MNYNIKLISEVSTAQSKRFYNNKQTLRPTINKDGQLNVIKTEVNKDELTYNEVTLNKSTINQLKHGIYDSFGKNKFIPTLKNLNNLDEIYLRDFEIKRIPELRWIYYTANKLTKNNPYICMNSNCLGSPAIIIIMLDGDFKSIKVVSNDIDLILWLDDIKYNYTLDDFNLIQETQREINDFKEVNYNLANYEEPLYERIDKKTQLKITEASDYDNWKYEVKDSTKNIVKYKRQINQKELLEKRLKRNEEKLNRINNKDYNIDDFLEYFFNEKLIEDIYEYVNKGAELYEHLNTAIDEETGRIKGVHKKDKKGNIIPNPIRLDIKHEELFNNRFEAIKVMFVIYNELTKDYLNKEIETTKNQLNKLEV